LPSTDGAEIGDFSAVILSDIGDGDGLFVDIHPDEKRVKLVDCVMADLRGSS
jgi:hypothetical protein